MQSWLTLVKHLFVLANCNVLLYSAISILCLSVIEGNARRLFFLLHISNLNVMIVSVLTGVPKFVIFNRFFLWLLSDCFSAFPYLRVNSTSENSTLLQAPWTSYDWNLIQLWPILFKFLILKEFKFKSL